MVAPTNRLDCNGITENEALDLVNTDLVQIIVTLAGTGKAMASAALRGAKGARITGAVGDGWAGLYSDTAASSASVQCYFRSRATPTVNNEFVGIRSASGNMARIVCTTALLLQLQDGAGTPISWATGTLTITNNTKYRCQIQATKGTTTANGTIIAQIYDDAGTLLRSVNTGATVNTGTADATTGRFGKVVSASGNVDMDIDEFAFITGTTAEIDDVASNFAPNAGPDQTVDAYAAVQLDATDLESVVVWTQTGGSPTVSLGGSGNNRTFVAPAVRAGTTLTFTATDAGSLTDTCTVTVYPHNEFAVVGGVEVPINYIAATLPDPTPQLSTTGLVAFYDADDTVGTDGTAVAAAPSGIVGAPDAIQGTGGNQPTLRTNAMYGHKAWDFGATNTTKRLALQGIVLDAARNKTDLIVSVVYKLPNSAITGTRCMFGLSNNSTGGRVAVFQNVTSTLVHRAGGRRLDADSFGQTDAAAGSTIGETAILTAEYKWGSSDLYLYKNGVLVASTTSFQTSGSTSDTSSLAGYIGCNGAAGEFFQGMIGQVIVKDVADPTGTVKQNIWDYQKYRYGLSGSTAAMPSEDMATFQQIWAEDFDDDVAEGGFTNMTTGSDLGKLNPASAGGAFYATSFKTAQNDSATGQATGCLYSTVKTTSVSGSVFRIRMHLEGSTPYSGKFKPMPPAPLDVNQNRCRIRYRARLVASTTTAWGTVFDLINPNTWFAGTGEYGHPENNHFSGNLGSFIRPSDHVTDPNRSSGAFVVRRDAVTYGAPSGLNDWHNYEILSEPGRMRLFIDDVAIWDDAVAPPTDPLGFVVQCGAGSTPPGGSEATVEIDWCVISKYIGP